MNHKKNDKKIFKKIFISYLIPTLVINLGLYILAHIFNKPTDYTELWIPFFGILFLYSMLRLSFLACMEQIKIFSKSAFKGQIFIIITFLLMILVNISRCQIND